MRTPLTDLLNLQLPLIQAPMAGVSTPELAAAVSNAGGLGSVALGALDPAQARAALAATRARTERPIAANVFVHETPVRDPEQEAAFLAALAPLFARAEVEPPAGLSEIYRSFNDDDAMLEVLLEARPEAVSLHFGPATPARVAALKAADIVLLATATTVEEAELLAAIGVDVIVLQAYAAGGHSGAFLAEPSAAGALTELVATAAATLDVPLVGAGGLMDGRDIHRVLTAGAAGAQLGTAFVGCPETQASEAYRRWLAAGGETRMTERISGRPARGLVNPLLEALTSLGLPVPEYPLTYDAIKQLVAAVNDPEFSVMWAGEGVARARFLPAAELVAVLAEELLEASIR